MKSNEGYKSMTGNGLQERDSHSKHNYYGDAITKQTKHLYGKMFQNDIQGKTKRE